MEPTNNQQNNQIKTEPLNLKNKELSELSKLMKSINDFWDEKKSVNLNIKSSIKSVLKPQKGTEVRQAVSTVLQSEEFITTMQNTLGGDRRSYTKDGNAGKLGPVFCRVILCKTLRDNLIDKVDKIIGDKEKTGGVKYLALKSQITQFENTLNDLAKEKIGLHNIQLISIFDSSKKANNTNQNELQNPPGNNSFTSLHKQNLIQGLREVSSTGTSVGMAENSEAAKEAAQQKLREEAQLREIEEEQLREIEEEQLREIVEEHKRKLEKEEQLEKEQEKKKEQDFQEFIEKEILNSQIDPESRERIDSFGARQKNAIDKINKSEMKIINNQDVSEENLINTKTEKVDKKNPMIHDAIWEYKIEVFIDSLPVDAQNDKVKIAAALQMKGGLLDQFFINNRNRSVTDVSLMNEIIENLVKDDNISVDQLVSYVASFHKLNENDLKTLIKK